jgi:hypothetical protein
MNKIKVSSILSFFLLVIFSCDQDIDIPESGARLNTFKMTLNENVWTPSDIDECTSTFHCQIAKIGENPFYVIKAYKDPQSIADLTSENFFQFQIMNVTEVGTYVIDGAFEGHFKNYARLTINDSNGGRVYDNEENGASFQVNVSRFYPLYGSIELKGIKGSFAGKLYNRDNPQDFIVIEGGEFEIQKANFFNFSQCKEN